MHSLKLLIASVLVIIFLAGCSKFKTEGWDAETFYTNAKEQLDDKKWSKAIELYQQLEAEELIHRHGSIPDASFSFKHALVQDAAYNSLLKRNREQLKEVIDKGIV